MSIIISGIRIPISHDENSAIDIALKKYGIPRAAATAAIYRVSIDARHGQLSRVVSVIAELSDVKLERRLAERYADSIRIRAVPSDISVTGHTLLSSPPVIVGFGPCGMFCSLILARLGFCPIILERGPELSVRDSYVDSFSSGCEFNPNANIQFGEGGAGAYSDGKLTTRINDPMCEYVLRELVRHGAPVDVMRSAKPHVGTDLLKNIVSSIKNEIISLGGKFYFNTRVDDIIIKNGSIRAVHAGGHNIPCDICILCVGHSARDTFSMLSRRGADMSPKSFSIGVRIEHLQSDINRSMFGKYAEKYGLCAAEYSLSHRFGQRGCYSFCMCPGGFVVAAASEHGGIVTNGMSFHARTGKNANSALAVSVLPSDFDNPCDPLSGVEFQRRYERRAFDYSSSFRAPTQLVGDFIDGRKSSSFSHVSPTYPLGTTFADLNDILPRFVSDGLKIGIGNFAGKIRAFSDKCAVLTAPETRTSSPLRINRLDNMQSVSIRGLIPCGEGAGYAGGIISAAVDGIRAASAICAEYCPRAF